MSKTQMDLAVKFLKHRLKSDRTTFIGNESEYRHINDLITRTSECGESNSALIIGTAGSGKSTMIMSILSKLLTKDSFRANTMVVNLNGYIHIDDAAALKSITKQMKLETAVNGKVFTTFADNLAFLLDCLKSGDRSSSKSVIFILEEFDLFCAHGNQTLIYNLFDVAQSAQAPICVIGLTRRQDVIELLEKRVKSRFSHRQIFLFNEICDVDEKIEAFLDLLKLPDFKKFDNTEYRTTKKYSKQSEIMLLRHDFDVNDYANQFKKDFITKWNKEINGLRTKKEVATDLEALFDHNATLAVQKTLLFRILSSIDDLNDEKCTTTTSKMVTLLHRIIVDDYLNNNSKVHIMRDLSILELSLMIAIKHHNDIYDGDPFNFEIILTRLHKFQSSGDFITGPTDRAVVLKAFDVLRYLGLIVPFGNSSKELKEFQMHRVQISNANIDKAVANYKHLPTRIMQWASSSQA
ncbi:origin recognition complex subunit 4 [Contarinia nasturtii]|uniref:origin recognition complex subunit 4 n=1 Tax=Contarinia nasturtii TaxID=265458 RepID=UPI0012D3C5D2|nr:origin recognition complex subunit 4 [Contarinia nasturtii]